MVKKNIPAQSGLTLLEVLVAIGIIAILLGLLLAGIMKVRETALRVQSTNNLKQIILAVHHFGQVHNGQLPSIGDIIPSPGAGAVLYPNINKPALLVRILPYIEQGNVHKINLKQRFSIPLYISPADPTAQEGIAKGEGDISSYAGNGVVFKDYPNLNTTFLDGTSNTIAFAEHYAYQCGNVTFYYWYHDTSSHRAAFADYGDVEPITAGNPPVSKPNVPGITFQVAPSRWKCNPGIAQTPHSSGMLVAVGDGSVRQLSPGISEATFWGSVTPNKGEILNDW